VLQHGVLFKCRSDVDESDKVAIYHRLGDLRESIPGFERIDWGANSSLEGYSQGFTDGYVIYFSDTAARDAYLSHPDLKAIESAFGALLNGGLKGLVVFDLDDRA